MITADTIRIRYAANIAFVAEEEPATTVSDFIDQLHTAAENFGMARFDTDELENAVTYLSDAASSTDETERAVLLKRAAENLAYVDDLADEYRLMV
ncbi:hypothetical protein OG369_43480 [Streptomyces sp. NBC_01221]|uniref:hypothetical protein n=1 Tax=Streptomyces sp. NBC_01221 TaxID=2903782 RepID=UPI002259AA86|nr:hypothetical protein [Streptomyces sp. NBC_01221]MCX4792641.1 hypothetical protein [Streptomyces sp. NBC_01221]